MAVGQLVWIQARKLRKRSCGENCFGGAAVMVFVFLGFSLYCEMAATGRATTQAPRVDVINGGEHLKSVQIRTCHSSSGVMRESLVP